MNRLRIATVLLALFLAAPTMAAAPSGLWAGKIGKAAVVACFDSDHPTYYYVKVGVDLALVARGSGIWDEKKGDEPSTGTWKLSPPKEDVLAGKWKSPDGKRTLPIRLEKQADNCESRTFNAARMAAVVRRPGKQETTAGLTTRSFQAADGNISGLEIVGDGAELGPLKGALEELNREIIGQYFDCMTFGASSAMQIEFSASVALAAVTEHFVMVRRSEGYWCGGAHPDDDEAVFIFDRKSAKTIDIRSWLKVEPDSLGRESWKSDREDCADAISEDTSFLVWPSASGLVFRPRLPHAIEACGDDVTVPYERLAAKLTAAGKRAVGEFKGFGQPAP